MKIAFLNPVGQMGGAEVCLLDMLSAIRTAQPRWNLRLFTGEDGPLLKQASELGVQCTAIEFPPMLAAMGDSGLSRPGQRRRARAVLGAMVLSATPSALGYSWKLRRELARFAPDVIHSNGLKMHFLGLWARSGGTPIVWHVHDYVSPRSLLRNVFRAQVNHCSAAIANSKSVAADIRQLCGRKLDQFDLQTVYNAVDLDRFNPVGTTVDLDKLSGLDPAPSQTVRVGLIATMAWWKGHRVFLDAIARLPRHISVRAYVIGGALYQTRESQLIPDELRAYASFRSITDRVGFTGFQSDIPGILRTLDVVVHASTEPEPFGRVVMESMACGRPVITSGLGGSAEIVAAGEGAVLHRAGDASSLAEAIVTLASDSQLRHQVGEQGRQTAEQHFDRRNLADQLLAIYMRARKMTTSPKLAAAGASS